MYDMNFFSVYKKRRAKSKGLKIFLAVFIVVLLLVNAGIIGGGLWLFNNMEEEIQEKEDWINDPATKEAIAEAERIQQEVNLLDEYLGLITTADANLHKSYVLKEDLVLYVQNIIPETTLIQSLTLNNRNLSISFLSQTIEDPMDLLFALNQSERLANVTLSSISIDQETDEASYSISMQVVGGDSE